MAAIARGFTGKRLRHLAVEPVAALVVVCPDAHEARKVVYPPPLRGEGIGVYEPEAPLPETCPETVRSGKLRMGWRRRAASMSPEAKPW